jgi:hypothetical protein
MAPSEHFISRVASRKWHSKLEQTKAKKTQNKKQHNSFHYSRTFFFHWFQTHRLPKLVEKKLSFLCPQRTANCWQSYSLLRNDYSSFSCIITWTMTDGRTYLRKDKFAKVLQDKYSIRIYKYNSRIYGI